ncbi:hypothetical protein MKY84_13670 [Chryseomicrobium sp. FSL W7-1435]|uniref:hypothetical protein n=1 Tax=Chryseomicrobium sp. FSL W7-1435 TaxID=2921704 RepID=UPI00315A16FB
MKKAILIGIAGLVLIGAIWFYFNQNQDTTFGEVYESVFNGSDISEVVIEEKLKNNFNSENEQVLDVAEFKEIIEQSSDMRLKESDMPPLNTYEMTIYYTHNGEEKMTAIVVGYNNTLQMVDGKFYTIESRNSLFELIYQEL